VSNQLQGPRLTEAVSQALNVCIEHQLFRRLKICVNCHRFSSFRRRYKKETLLGSSTSMRLEGCRCVMRRRRHMAGTEFVYTDTVIISSHSFRSESKRGSRLHLTSDLRCIVAEQCNRKHRSFSDLHLFFYYAVKRVRSRLCVCTEMWVLTSEDVNNTQLNETLQWHRCNIIRIARTYYIIFNYRQLLGD
jgi:hypothetical protein